MWRRIFIEVFQSFSLHGQFGHASFSYTYTSLWNAPRGFNLWLPCCGPKSVAVGRLGHRQDITDHRDKGGQSEFTTVFFIQPLQYFRAVRWTHPSLAPAPSCAAPGRCSVQRHVVAFNPPKNVGGSGASLDRAPTFRFDFALRGVTRRDSGHVTMLCSSVICDLLTQARHRRLVFKGAH